MDKQEQHRILFICMGNICRSPTVEGIARVEFARAGFDAVVDSAGTEDYHIGEPPDERAIRAAAEHGYDIADLRARQVTSEDFESFHLVFAMDRMNLLALQRFHRGLGVAPELFLVDTELPDPYYGTTRDFERVVQLARNGVDALIRRLQAPGARRT